VQPGRSVLGALTDPHFYNSPYQGCWIWHMLDTVCRIMDPIHYSLQPCYNAYLVCEDRLVCDASE
jgi:hypothetical protein